MLEKSSEQQLAVTAVSTFYTVRLFAEKVAGTMSSAVNKLKFLIGTFIGFLAVSKMLPFALAVILGVNKGVKQFRGLTECQELHGPKHKEDLVKINRFTALLLLVCGSVVMVPLLVVVIFIYQGYANYYFCFAVVGIEVMVMNLLLVGYISRKTDLIMKAIAVLLIVLGGALWVAFDEDGLLQQALLLGTEIFAAAQLLPNIVFIIKLGVGVGFNFFFSKLVATNIVAAVTANMFGDYDDEQFRNQMLELLDVVVAT